MEIKLIKTEVNYLLKNEEGVIIASTSIKKGISSLSKQNCDELFGVFDVEKLASEAADNYDSSGNWHVAYELYKSGFNKAMELNKGKVFTYNQMVSAITESSISHRLLSLIIQDLQPTEIEVEIDMSNIYAVPEPKIDSEGNLILKKI